MALLEVPYGVIYEIYQYLDCDSLWNLSRTHSRFSDIQKSDELILELWKNVCKRTYPSIGQYPLDTQVCIYSHFVNSRIFIFHYNSNFMIKSKTLINMILTLGYKIFIMSNKLNKIIQILLEINKIGLQ